ncbi:MAG: alpha-1,2-fucosyltransferase [Spirochaetales bacterium]|nr:alpha-1,2-fucosyltransferase [Spirochaetales bacterium]
MKIVKVHGGLGNQMFQYAFARSLGKATGDEIFIDASAFGDDPAHNGFELDVLFAMALPLAEARDVDRLSTKPRGALGRFRRKYFTKSTHFIDRKFGWQPEVYDMPGDRYFEGYWQSEKYFEGIAGDLRAEFAFKPPLSDRNRRLLESVRRPVASVHVRRGDYLAHPNLDICTPDYYRRAAESMRAAGAASFLVFSDDLEYCRNALELGPTPATFVDWNRGALSWQDMAMMSACDHHVVANSSFSWWGAWLDSSPEKRVVAPTVWNRREIEDRDHYYSYRFGDVVPESWERIPI